MLNAYFYKSIRVGTNRNDGVGTTAVPARTDTVSERQPYWLVPTPDYGKTGQDDVGALRLAS